MGEWTWHNVRQNNSGPQTSDLAVLLEQSGVTSLGPKYVIHASGSNMLLLGPKYVDRWKDRCIVD